MFPHYKFNLTNGSENLETMEYMKCGRVYHAGGGDAGWYRRQYCQGRSIFSESAAARGRSKAGKGGESGSRQGRAGERQNMLLARQEVARGGRRTVPVAFESRANAANKDLSFLPKNIFFSRIVRPLSRKFNRYVVKKSSTIRPASERCTKGV